MLSIEDNTLNLEFTCPRDRSSNKRCNRILCIFPGQEKNQIFIFCRHFGEKISIQYYDIVFCLTDHLFGQIPIIPLRKCFKNEQQGNIYIFEYSSRQTSLTGLQQMKYVMYNSALKVTSLNPSVKTFWNNPHSKCNPIGSCSPGNIEVIHSRPLTQLAMTTLVSSGKRHDY